MKYPSANELQRVPDKQDSNERISEGMTASQPKDDESKACPACGAGGCSHWFAKDGYDHLRCPVCRHGFVHPVPPSEVIAAYYAELSGGLTSYASWETEPRHKIRLWARLLEKVRQWSGDGPLVDLGCGAGQFLKRARERGWESLTGIEISAKAAAMARDTVPVPIHESAWRDVALDKNHFAAAALLDVLEHEPDPRALLQHVFDLLRPGGCLIITVPNTRGVSLRCLGRSAYAVIPPEHLSYFCRESLGRMLSEVGFDRAYDSTCDIYLKEWLRFVPGGGNSSGSESAGAVQRAHYERSYRRMTGSLALYGISAVNILLGLVGAGDQLVVIARKPPEKRDEA